MFTPPRFLVVDDKPAHLEAIVKVFQELGAPCMGLVFDPVVALNAEHFRGVRALFMDLHLIDGAATTDNKRHFANIASILEANMSPLGGPFILVVWTEHAHLEAELAAYLNTNLDPAKLYAKPLAVLSVAKERFIDVSSGATKNASALRDAVTTVVGSNAQLAALLSWETDALQAAGATLSTLMDLVPATERTTAGYPEALDIILSRLAREAVGKSHVATDPRSAIAAALAPILADRIVNQEATPALSALWATAVTKATNPALGDASPSEAGRINRMLHVALPGSERINPSDWGAVCAFPEEWWNKGKLTELFGVTLKELLGDEFKIPTDARADCLPRLVRVGAACDHAQNRRGPITFLFGLEIPGAITRVVGPRGKVDIPGSEWMSPDLLMDEARGPFSLAVNTRYPVTLPRAGCAAWGAVYRLREQLLVQLVNHASAYIMRPGIVRL